MCLAVACHLNFWQNDHDLLRATAVSRGWNGYRYKSQHRKLTLDKEILPPLLPGLEPAPFRPRVRRSTTELSQLTTGFVIQSINLITRKANVESLASRFPDLPPSLGNAPRDLSPNLVFQIPLLLATSHRSGIWTKNKNNKNVTGTLSSINALQSDYRWRQLEE